MIHAEIRALHRYWQTLRNGRQVPFRAEVDPRDMDCDARNLLILEDLGGGNVRFRLAGTALVDAFGMELRGMSARSIMAGKARESFGALIAETLAEPGIGYARLTSEIDAAEVWEVLLLPLKSDFGATDRILGCLHPLKGRSRPTGRARLRFHIDSMSIRPVEADRIAPLPSAVAADGLPSGFAEGQTPFAGPDPAPRRGERGLRAIEGGRTEPNTAERGNDRGHLRLVKDD
ncbi:MAG: PAS domain-containing protein [Paracoccaceae bacterium]